MDKYRVMKQVLKKVTPTPQEHRKSEAVLTKVTDATEKVIRPKGLHYIVAGSYTRNTYMPDKKEFDIFIMFPEDTPREKLEKQGLQVGKAIVRKLKGTYQIAYAEHPYTRSRVGKYSVDIVPCYKLRSARYLKSAVDRTPFHNEWLKKNFQPELSKEVRLLKQFTKAQRVYGSDTRVQGFSGYLCELLIVHYRTFENLVKDAAKWEPGQMFIDPERQHRKPDEIKPRFKDQPLIVIDPVDPIRNVAAAMSPANFSKFVDACKTFVKKPSPTLFTIKPRKFTLGSLERRMKARKTRFLGILFGQPQIIQDVLWPQMRRCAKRLRDIMEEYEFHVIGFDVWSDPEFTKGGKALILLEMEVWDLPDIRRVKGPSVFIKKHSDQFIKKYKPRGRLMVDDHHWTAEIPREWKKAEGKLKDSLSDPVKVLQAKGIPKYIAQSVSKRFRLLRREDVLKMVKRKKELGEFILDYLEKQVL